MFLNRLLICLMLVLPSLSSQAFSQQRPNVIVIMTDDQGIGDFGCMGNPLVETPNIDAMFNRSVHFSNFFVSPVCAPTRASLMTGRYAYRTRVVDTFNGRAMMDSSEVTMAELFQGAGYATGIFGKWHLGDCYPMRPMDQGFSHSVVHRGGGIGQSSDPPGAAGAYTNPILFQNGEPRRERGYCTDVYYDHAIEFMQQCTSRELPFLVYLTDNCPHGPFKDVPKDWWEKYKDADLTADKYPAVEGGNPVSEKTNADVNARVYSMVSNIDENIGRLKKALNDLELSDNTIVVFLTDNGPNGDRFRNGLRGKKTSVYEGGIKTLCLMEWPAKIKQQRTISELAAHIDLFPTLLEACGVPREETLPRIDGTSLMPLLNQEDVDWKATREPVFIQVHRGNTPQRHHHFAVRDHRWKLVHHSGFRKEQFEGKPKFELFNIENDPFEKSNVADQHPELVRQMVAKYDSWFDDVSSTRQNNYECPRIVVDPTHEKTTVLTRQDCRREKGATDWGDSVNWQLRAKHDLVASIACRFNNLAPESEVSLFIGETQYKTEVDEFGFIAFDDVAIPPGNFVLRAVGKNETGKTIAAYQVYLTGAIKR
jgi:arylsulfatase/arylsulfatase A